MTVYILIYKVFLLLNIYSLFPLSLFRAKILTKMAPMKGENVGDSSLEVGGFLPYLLPFLQDNIRCIYMFILTAKHKLCCC